MKKNRLYPGFILFFCIYIFISVQKRSYRLFSIGKTGHIQYIYMGISDFLQKNYYKGVLSEKIRQELELTQKSATPFITVGINVRYLQRKISGIERYITELIFNLSEIDTQNTYLLFLNKDSPIPQLPKTGNFKVIISKFPTKYRLLRLIWEHFYLRYEIKKHNVSVFHGPAFFVPFLKPKNCKYVLTVHDITFIKYPEAFTLGTRLYYTLLFPRSLKLADAIITDSVSTKNDIMQHYHLDDAKINVIHLGVSKIFLKKHERKCVKEIKLKYSLPKKYLLFIGVLSPRKNIETIIETFCLLKNDEQYKDYKLLIVGRKGWLYEKIFAKVELLQLKKDVFFIEDVPEADLPYFYLLTDVFIFPSLYEGFGLPILEAMASRCPVITSNVSSMPEVAGNAAILIEPTKKDELSTAIRKVLNDKRLRREMLENGITQLKKFSWEKTAEETKNIYETLVMR